MFDNPFSMVVAIVALVMFTSIIRTRIKARHGIIEDRSGQDRLVHDPDTDRLREEIKTLKERVAVLERIATDKTHRLESEIEALRDER